MNTNKQWEELVKVPENYHDMPPQMLHDMLSAIRSFDHLNDQLFLEDFEWEFVGPKGVEELREYDTGIDKWLILRPSSTFNDLRNFRGYRWMCKASKWLKEGVPPVVAIEYMNRCQIGDGRGRVNIANMAGYQVPLYFMRYKYESIV